MTANSPSIPSEAGARPSGRPRSTTLRRCRESAIVGLLVICGAFTIATTLTIMVILANETLHFFLDDMTSAQAKAGESINVSVTDFLFDLNWAPLLGGEQYFGIWPLIWSTLMVTAVAMAVAVPLGLITAIWLSEYAHPRVRGVIKPVLEVLAGIPTVVFGFFALTVITPALKLDIPILTGDGEPLNPFGFSGSANALSAGLAVGLMTLPIVTSLSEDAFRAVPKALREGAYGLGASRFEASIRVVFPAALSGIIAASLLAFARAVGETMIVALAAGSRPVPLHRVIGEGTPLIERLTIPFDVRQEVQPMTGYMVQIFAGDAPHGGVEYFSAYAVGATLFVITLGLTMFGGFIRKRYRQVYN